MSSKNNRLRKKSQYRSDGMSKEDQRSRQYLLTQNLDKVKDVMVKSIQKGMSDPVGIVGDLRNHHAQQLSILLHRNDGLTTEEAEKKVRACIDYFKKEEAIPTLNTAIPLETAERLLPLTSPTATQSLANWKALRQPGQYLVVCIASGGNRYAGVYLEGDAS